MPLSQMRGATDTDRRVIYVVGFACGTACPSSSSTLPMTNFIVAAIAIFLLFGNLLHCHHLIVWKFRTLQWFGRKLSCQSVSVDHIRQMMFCLQSRQIEWKFYSGHISSTSFFVLDDLHLWNVLNFVGKWIFLSLSVGERSIHIRLFVFISLTHPTVQGSGRKGAQNPKNLTTWYSLNSWGVQSRCLCCQFWAIWGFLFCLISVAHIWKLFGFLSGVSLLFVFVFVHLVGMLSAGGSSFIILPLSRFLPLGPLFFILAFSWKS